jgi:hypothetical protein
MIGAERSCVFPLRINRSIPFANRDPSILAGGNAGALVRFLEPWDDPRRFRPVATRCLVIVREGAVKRVLSRRELYRNVIAAMRGIRIVKPAITSAPMFVQAPVAPNTSRRNATKPWASWATIRGITTGQPGGLKGAERFIDMARYAYRWRLTRKR